MAVQGPDARGGLVMRVTYDEDPPNTIVLDEFENNYQRVRNP